MATVARQVHVCYVAENFKRRTSNDPPEKSRVGCLPKLKRFWTSKMTIMDTMGPSPGILKELEEKDRSNCNKVRLEVGEGAEKLRQKCTRLKESDLEIQVLWVSS
ncbi:hypothetical protein PoB_000976900 [Plakobranchus ocellatus]|uniref:Uncharacterized protein n=1 Tax=Plakobranchus ocellatus TaxID=259542 RepID=A0AAV3YJS0_9GAST|nr:hypothetical protein PoB_000976900 [Plakobranchus ocellatus]